MTTSRVFRTVGRIQYTVVSTSLDILDSVVIARFGDESAVRRSFDSARDHLDNAVGAMLHEPDLQPIHVPAPAEPAPQQATPEPDDIGPVDVDVDVGTSADAEPAPSSDEIEELADTLLAEQQPARMAGELAENDELRKVQAELNAKRLIEEGNG